MSEVLHINDTDVDSGDVIASEEPEEPRSMKQEAQISPQKPSLEETIERRRLIQSIHRQVSEFPKRLDHVDLASLEEMSLEELVNLKQENSYAINIRGQTSSVEGMYKLAAIGFETLACSYTPLKLEGISGTITQPHIMDIVREIALDYEEYLYFDPKYRLAQALVVSIGSVHYQNVAKEAHAQAQAQAKPEEPATNVTKNEKYKDL